MKQESKSSRFFNFEEEKDCMSEQKCLHESCPDCNGSGVKKNGQPCIHMLSCPCRRCSFTF